MKNIQRTRCLCCKKKNLNEIINLGEHSFADRFIPKNKQKINNLHLKISTGGKELLAKLSLNLYLNIYQ